MFGFAESEHPRLTKWCNYFGRIPTYVIDRQTDDMRSQDRALH